jgi:peptidoglycan/xylan/chitin deacetylase (PgdA/CDA1 family)
VSSGLKQSGGVALNTIRDRIASEVFSRLPGRWLKNLVEVNPKIAYYHIVSDEDVPHVKHLYPIRSVDQFRKDLDTFLSLYKPITLHELVESIRGGRPLAVNSFLLTFDDGFREIFEVIAPILLGKGIPAAFFLCSAFLDNLEMAHHNKISLLLDHLVRLKTEIPRKMIFDILRDHGIESRDVRTSLLSISYRNKDAVDKIAAIVGCDFNSYLSVARPYVSSGEVRKLIDMGFSIGAHSIDHPLYSALSLREQLYQTQTSVRFIRERFQLPYGAFAFPHGDSGVPERFFQEIFTQEAVDVSFGTRGMVEDALPRHFQRFSMEYDSAPTKRVLGRHYARSFFKGLMNDGIVKRASSR